MNARPTCPAHPGVIRPCHHCEPEARAALRAQRLQEVPVDTNVATLPRQETLSDEVFPPVKREDIPMVKLAFAGSVEMTVGRFLELLDGDLEVGGIVECQVTGHFKKLGTGWRKRSEGAGEDKMTWWEKEGLPGIAVDEVGALHITGDTWSDE